jgi:squalene-hopene/tetraprenyl-beta-curcumene cyclase
MAVVIVARTSSSGIGQDGSSTKSERHYREMVDKNIEYLRLRGQAEDGSFSAGAGIGPTALVVSGLLSVGVSVEDPMVAKSLGYLEKFVQKDGGIYASESLHRNYETCIAMVAFSKADNKGKYAALVKKAESFVRGIQWDESEGKDESDLFYGGAGYGSHSRPDLSNTSFLVDALRTLGNDADDEGIQKALTFVSRCQNLESPANTSPHAAKVNDGGFYYTVAAGGESKAEPMENGGLRSYGSMTYAGLKSMIYAGLTQDDPRVKAATEFIRKNYDLEVNPGLGQQGLFYYYHTMAKALDAVGEEKFKDADGVEHDWKSELREKLSRLQQQDGSWVNETTRWMEGDPNLVAGYTLLALAYCKP